MSRPRPAINLDNIPCRLKQHAQWVVWRYIKRNGKDTKVPFNARTGGDASVTDPETWSTFDNAVTAWQPNVRWEGIGFVFSADDPFCGIDLDDAVDTATGEPKPWAEEIIAQQNTYGEISPSGGGVKLIAEATKVGTRCRTAYADGKVEIYDRRRFFALTGRRLDWVSADVEQRQEAVEQLYRTVFKAADTPAAKASIPPAAMLAPAANAAAIGATLSDEQILEKAKRSGNSGTKFSALWAGRWEGYFPSQSEADSSVVFTLAFYTKDAGQIDRLFRTSGLMREKWDEHHGERTYGRMTIDNALAEVKGQWQPRSRPPAAASNGQAAATQDGGRPDARYIVDRPEPMRLAEHYLDARRRSSDGTLTLRRYRQEWWAFENGGYRTLSEEVALADLYRHLDLIWTPVRDSRTGIDTGTYQRLVARSTTVNEVARAIPACGAIVEGEMPRWLDGRGRDGNCPDPADVVAFRNGLLDTAAYCRGQERLVPLTPSWFAGVACPYDFDPAATCPNWLAFLNAAFDRDEQCISLLQEWYGLNLIPDNRYERLMLLVGPPRAGKGTALEVLGAMLGEGQIASTSFSKLASRFGLAPLVGRLAAILPDAHVGSGTDAKAALEVLKSISGNDAQAVDRKGIDELPRVRLFCRFSIAVNELPKLPDEAGALKTRLLLLHFRNSFAGREDTTLKARLRAEAPGVAVWALQGLRRLRAAGTFTVPARSASMVSEFEKIISPVLGFLDDCCELCSQDPQGVWVEKDVLFDAWCRWCQDRGSTAGSKADFGQALLNANRGIGAGRRGPRGQQFTVYTGVRPCQ